MHHKLLVLPAAADMHLHMRNGLTSKSIAHFTAQRCHRVLVMPNTVPGIETAAEADQHKKTLQPLLPNVDILTSIKITPRTTPQIIRDAAKAGVSAVKLYPEGVTTNSYSGISSAWLDSTPPQQFLDCIDMIRRSGMIFCMHGEMPLGKKVESKNAESKFLDFVDYLAINFPKLRMVLEHITTAEQVRYVRRMSKHVGCSIGATITAHHLWLTMDDVIGQELKPHNFCKPIPKWSADREALREAAMSGDPCFFFGSDSAPHEVGKKECLHGCAGCFTSPLMVETCIEVFELYNKLDKLPDFLSTFGNAFYQQTDTSIPIRKYERTRWYVPTRVGATGLGGGNFRPWRAGEPIEWSIVL